MKRIALCTTTVLLLTTCFSTLLTSCSPKGDSSSNELESQVDSAPEDSAGYNTPNPLQNADTMYTKIQLDLPEDITEVPTRQFDFQDSNVGLISIGEDYFSYAVDITSDRDGPDQKIYKCDISSGEIIELDGIATNWNLGTAQYAVCDDNVYMFYETLGDRVLINFDFHDNKTNVLKKEEIDYDTDSFYWSYPISQTEYAVHWFNFGQYRKSIHTNHMILVDESGEETELFTDKTDSKKIIDQVDVTEDKIYRLFYNITTNDVNVSAYDLSGALVEQYYLPEITNYLRYSDDTNFKQFAAAGSCVAITLDCIPSVTYIYDLEKHTYMIFENTYVMYNNSLNSFNGFVLERTVYDSDGSSTQDLLVLNTDSNSVYKITGDLGSSLAAITNGEKVAYRQDHSVFLCDISELSSVLDD